MIIELMIVLCVFVVALFLMTGCIYWSVGNIALKAASTSNTTKTEDIEQELEKRGKNGNI